MKTNPRKYKILYVNPTSNIGGDARSLLVLCRGIDRKVFQPILIIPDCNGPLNNELNENNIEYEIFSLNRLRKKNPFPYLQTVAKLVRFIVKNKVDLIHSNIRFTNQYLVVAARLTGVPILSHVRGFLTREWYLEYLLWLSDNIIANSYATESCYLPFLRKNQKSRVIYNSIDLAEYDPNIAGDSIRRKYGIDNNSFLIGLVGRIIPEKGHFWFLKAFKKLVETASNVQALIIGDTSIDGKDCYFAKLRAMVCDLGLEKKVIFTGFISDMPQIYRDLDLLVLPTWDKEAFGRVFIEAMAMEKPVISTNAGAVPEVVAHGETGFLLPHNDIDGLKEAMLKFICNPKLAKDFGKKGRERVKELFDSRIYIKKIERLYLDILEPKVA